MAGKPQRSVKHPPIQVGDKFHRLTVVALADPDKHGQTHWHCICDCGKHRVVMGLSLKRGNTKSCGCYRKEVSATRTHGMSHLPEHATWCNMIGRCRRTDDDTPYARNGIYVCEAWHDFPTFYADMGEKPSPEHSIDRIDNDGSYTCGKCAQCIERGATKNCRWATWTEQMRNTSRSHLATHNGRTMTLAEWAEEQGVPYYVVFERIKQGLSPIVD